MSRLPIANLLRPFSPDDIEWRVGNVAKNGQRCTLLAYITSRAVMDRLDAVVGPENWSDEYIASPIGAGLECRLSIRMSSGEWVTKIDGAEPTKVESLKGAYSDSLKRAAVKWGIGRYLYRLPLVWVEIKDSRSKRKGDIYVSSRGQSGYATPPQLPDFALPVTMRNTAPQVAAGDPLPPVVETLQPKPAPIDEPVHDKDWEDDRKWFCATMDKHGGYAKVKEWTLSKNWGKPSTWGTERRRNFAIKLAKNELKVGE